MANYNRTITDGKKSFSITYEDFNTKLTKCKIVREVCKAAAIAKVQLEGNWVIKAKQCNY